MLLLYRKRHIPTPSIAHTDTHIHKCTKPLVNSQHQLGAHFLCGQKNEKWEKTQHTVYMQLTLIKSSSICLLGPFYGAFLFVFGKQKTKKPMCVCAHVSRLKCILDTTKQYCIKCLPCHPPTLSSPSKHRWKKGKVKRQSNQKKVADQLTEKRRVKKMNKRKSRKSFWMACEVGIAENVNKFN